jgi:hypothetical protein
MLKPAQEIQLVRHTGSALTSSDTSTIPEERPLPQLATNNAMSSKHDQP